jgi:dTDP-4-amino-4,6-dideoxygalactose transaminase
MEGIEVVNGPGESARTIYTIRVKHGRDQLLEFLTSRGVEAKVFYPRPLHLQRFYMEMGLGGNRLPVSEAASREVLSLPLYPGMKREEQQYVIDTVAEGWSKISRTTP